MTSDTARALSAFACRRFTDWQGLPPDCTLADLTAHAPLLDEAVGHGVAGARRLWSQFRLVSFPHYPEPVRAWFAENRLWMLDVDYPALPEPPARMLGAPEARLDCHWDLLRLEAGEWAYPSRGLSAIVNPVTERCLRLAVFVPTTLTAWVQDIRRSTTPTEDDASRCTTEPSP
jgi:hypothetical protein